METAFADAMNAAITTALGQFYPGIEIVDLFDSIC
jgi:hypothetical protein